MKSNGNKTLFTEAEYNEYVRILRYWNQADGHIDTDTGRPISRKEFRKNAGKTWYETAKRFKVFEYTQTDGKIEDVLRRYDTDEKVWKIVVHANNVFDALMEIHKSNHYMKLDYTKHIVDQKYWNISKRLCRNFLQTCPTCRKIRRRRINVTPTANPPSIEAVTRRYIGCIIDQQHNPQMDWNGNQMSFILIIRDRIASWTVLRPLAKIDGITVEMEILTVLSIKVLPRRYRQNQIATIASMLGGIISKRVKRLKGDVNENDNPLNDAVESELNYMDDQVRFFFGRSDQEISNKLGQLHPYINVESQSTGNVFRKFDITN